MKKKILAAMVGLGFCFAASAAEQRIGKIVSAGTVISNTTTASAFSVPSGSKLTVQCDADVYLVISSQIEVVATVDDLLIPAGSVFPTSTPKSTGAPGFVSVLPVSGAANCRVFVRSGNEA